MKPILVFQTDFTYKEGAVSSMYGVVKRVDRELEIFDSTHEVPNYDIWSASFRLFQPMKFWPEGTVFVSVVDPGVGTPRKASIALTNNGYYIVTPDNGTLTHVDKVYGIERIIEIDIDTHRLKGLGTEGISVFHGRDVFAYCAARLASGQVPFEAFGHEYPVSEIVRFELLEPYQEAGRVGGMAEIIDPNFGNLWTNIPMAYLADRLGEKVQVQVYDGEGARVFDEEIVIHKTFGDVPKGALTIYQNEYGNASIAINQGSFIRQYPIPYGANIRIEMIFRGDL
ncbi:SAM-dependent chlorinase/fluorinase [Aerococcaceae bacterium NML201296]|nr:SAM-dependent chlorinase/fluorinase [Aerococcaceae bacterium NML201296]MCW6674848.1 SAM-dependent chlorinase/fluorinase [Aerococcaceae bacterium NML171108]